MPRPWQNPRWRRILMQLSLWLVLAASTAIAALVAKHRNLASHIDLSNPVTASRFSLRIPTGWVVDPDAAVGSIVLVAHEEPPAAPPNSPTPLSTDDPDADHRTLIVRVRPLHHTMTPLQFLQQSGLLQGALTVDTNNEDAPQDDSPTPDDLNPVPTKPITVAATPGILVKILRPVGINPATMRPLIHEELLAATILPTQQALVLILDCPTPDTGGDSATLLGNIAGTVRILPPATPPAPTDDTPSV